MFEMFKQFFSYILLLNLLSVAYPANGAKVFVSSSIGNDLNNGLDTDHPIKDLTKAVKMGDEILLKAGDVFYVGDLSINGKVLSRYGEGTNPTICGYKRIITPKWQEVEKNIWRLSLVEDNYLGIIIHGSSTSNNICSFHDYEKDLIHGRKVRYKKEMTDDWDFWQTETLKGAKPEEYDYVYLYLSSNPNMIKLEMSIYDVALKAVNSTIEGVNFMGFGTGISAKTETVIRNCKIDGIGGRIIKDGRGYVCYGNGVEFYVAVADIENCLVEDCYISRCYDCGITIQGTGATTATPRNITIRNNLITNCCQGWEDFLRNNPDVVFETCVFTNNIVLRSGNTTGFGYSKTRFKYCHVLGNNVAGDKGMQIENNVFASGNYYCSGVYNNLYRSNRWKGNKCYISEGDYILGEYFGKRDVLRMCSSRRKSSEQIKRYRELTGDESTTFYVLSPKRVTARANKLEKKFLKTHSY